MAGTYCPCICVYTKFSLMYVIVYPNNVSLAHKPTDGKHQHNKDMPLQLPTSTLKWTIFVLSKVMDNSPIALLNTVYNY